jgi:hypothetical protein
MFKLPAFIGEELATRFDNDVKGLDFREVCQLLP